MSHTQQPPEHEQGDADLLPICTTLGCSVNLAQQGVNPFHILDVLNASSKATIVHMSDKGREVTPPGCSKKYWKPGNATIMDEGTSTESHSLVVKTGEELSHDFEANANLSIAYGGLSVSASSQYSYQSSIKSTSVYGNYSFEQRVYSIKLPTDPYKLVDSKLVDEVLSLPQWNQDQAAYEKYRLFFQKWGTHVILECFLGTRYQLLVESMDTSSEKKQDIKACISMEYKGLVSGGGGVVDDKTYSAYQDVRQADCVVRGGDEGKAGVLERDPTSMDKFNAWQETRKLDAMDGLLSAKAESLAVFLAASPVQSHIGASQRLKPALDYFSTFRTLTGVFKWEVPFMAETAEYRGGTQDVFDFTCTISPLPGLVIRPGSVSGWTITQLSPSSFAAKQNPHRVEIEPVPVTIIAPMHPVDVDITFKEVLGSFMFRLFLGLSHDATYHYGYRTVIFANGGKEAVHVPKLDAVGEFK